VEESKKGKNLGSIVDLEIGDRWKLGGFRDWFDGDWETEDEL
jgi:hypothetical protein